MRRKFPIILSSSITGFLFASGQAYAALVGAYGTSGADGVVTLPPSGDSSYQWISTYGGVDGVGELTGIGGTNGSSYTTDIFRADAGSPIKFAVNFITSDGADFSDYAWAQLQTPSGTPVATLFTAQTQPSGDIVPGLGLPGVAAILNPSSAPIIGGAPNWLPLGGSSGSCFADGCGYTGWISSTYDIKDAGNYVLKFGVTNWSDNAYDSGLAFDNITVNGMPVPVSAVPVPASFPLFASAVAGLVGFARLRRQA